MYEKPLKYQALFDYLKRNLLFIKIEVVLFLITAVVLSFAASFAIKDPNLKIQSIVLFGGSFLFFGVSCYFVYAAINIHNFLKNWNKYDS